MSCSFRYWTYAIAASVNIFLSMWVEEELQSQIWSYLIDVPMLWFVCPYIVLSNRCCWSTVACKPSLQCYICRANTATPLMHLTNCYLWSNVKGHFFFASTACVWYSRRIFYYIQLLTDNTCTKAWLRGCYQHITYTFAWTALTSLDVTYCYRIWKDCSAVRINA